MVKLAAVVVVVVLLAILAFEAFIAEGGPESTIGSDNRSTESAGHDMVNARRSALELRAVENPSAADEVDTIDPSASPVEDLSARPRLLIRVQVVDEVGSPQPRIPVTIAVRDAKSGSRRDLLSLPTDATGRVAFDIQAIGAGYFRLGKTIVALAGSLGERDEHVVDALHPAPEPVRLVLREYGRIVVHFAPVLPPEGFRLRLRSGASTALFAPVAGQDIEIAPVELGGRFWLNLDGPRDCEVEFRGIEIDGPARAGETRLVDYDTSEAIRRPLLVARLLDSAGRPLVGSHVEAFRLDASNTGIGMKTDDAGRVREKFNLKGEFQFATHSPSLGRLISEPLLVAFDSNGSQHDLGDVELHPMPLLAAGRVVDQGGNPVPGTRVMLAKVDRGMRLWTSPFGGFTSVVCNDEGRFELRDHCPATIIQLDVNGPNHSLVQVETAAGIDDLEIRVLEYGGLRLHCLAAPGGGLGSLVLRGARIERDGTENGLERPIPLDGALQYEWLAPGHWDFRLLRRSSVARGTPDPVIRRWSAEIVESGRTLDLGGVTVPASGIESSVVGRRGRGRGHHSRRPCLEYFDRGSPHTGRGKDQGRRAFPRPLQRRCFPGHARTRNGFLQPGPLSDHEGGDEDRHRVGTSARSGTPRSSRARGRR